MSLSENLQNLRKIKNMSQEELAEKLNVSRQAVSKWESGNGYPETEKIISICEIFDCSMDQLVKGKISNDIKSEKNNYDLIMTKAAKGISLGVAVILLGVSIMLTILGFASNEQAEEQYALIGVIAVLTVPSVIQDYKNKLYVAQLKKAFYFCN
jgi:transcriptional regulator with XRE-family HTH domain